MTSIDAAESSFEVLGQTVTLPVQVRAARQAAATFLVDAGAAQRIIEPSGLKVERKAGRAMASLAVVDYADNDLGQYHELALAFVVKDAPGAPVGPKSAVSTLIWRLPVDGEFTCVAGRDIWGFPKWVTGIDVRFGSRGATATLTEGGLEVLRLHLTRGVVPMPSRPMEMKAYSYLDGVLRCTPWTTRSAGRQTVRPGGATLELGYGHPIADELRALGFPRRAVMTMFDDHMTATFGGAVVV